MIVSKTKSSSQTLHTIENVYFHQLHLKGKQYYGYKAVVVMPLKIINTFVKTIGYYVEIMGNVTDEAVKNI